MYAIVFLISIFGNTLVLVIIYRKKSMKTVNNYFLANITLSNLIYTLCVPFQFIIEISDDNGKWIYFEMLCPLLPIINTMSINLNTFTMIASAIERLIVIICPFRTKLSKTNCLVMILFIWILSFGFGLPWGFLIKVQIENTSYMNDLNSSPEKIEFFKICVPPLQSNDEFIRFYFILLSFLQYIIPLIVLIITYSIIIFYINVVNAKSIKNDQNKSNIKLRKRNEHKVNFDI